MSKKKASKDPLANLDDVLGDLLGDDDGDKPKKTTTVTGKPKAAPKSKKPNLDDDEFYRQLAAQAGMEEVSDISEADPAEMAKTIDGLDDMDATLFKGKNTSPAKTPTTATKSTPSPRASKQQKPSSGNMTNSPRGRPHSALDDLLSSSPPGFMDARANVASSSSNALKDTNPPRDSFFADSLVEEKPKAKAKVSSKTFSDFDEDDPLAGLLSSEDELSTPRPKPILKKPTTPDSRPETGGAVKSDDSGSRRLDVDRPPTRSGNYTPEQPNPGPKKGAKRQDEAMFGDDTDVLGGMGLDSPTRENKPFVPSADDPLPGGAKSVMDDLLGSTDKPSITRPGTGERKGFVLDAKYTKQGQQQKKGEEVFTFGGYMPSTAGGSRPNSRRNVRFDDTLERPRSTPASTSMLDKSDDWLGMASANNRPGTDSGIRGKAANNQNASQEPVDWLGFSRLGSPDSSRTTADWETDEEEEVPDRKPEKAPTKDKPISGPQSSYQASFSTSPDQMEPSDWLGTKRPGSGGQKKMGNDWLGATSSLASPRSKPADDLLGGAGLGKGTNKEEDDFLGLGEEVDLDSLLPKKPKSPIRPERTADDLFKTPISRKDMSATFPSSSARQQQPVKIRTSAPVPVDKMSPRSNSLQESPRSVSDSLDAIIKAAAEKQKRAPQQTHKPTVVVAQQPVSMPVTSGFTTGPVTGSGSSAVPSGLSSAVSMASALPSAPVVDLTSETQYMKQLADQQTAVQQQIRQQQERLRQQQEQQLQQLQREQQRLLQQPALTQPSMDLSSQGSFKGPGVLPYYTQYVQPGMFGSLGGMGLLGQDYESRIQKLELEKRHIESMLETTKKQHDEQMRLLEESHRKKVDLLEQTFEQRERRLKDENEVLSNESMEKLRKLETERTELVSSHLKKQQDMEAGKKQEIEQMREQHRLSVQELRREQDEAIERLKRVKEQEMEAVVNKHSHSQALKDVIDRVDYSVRDLEGLHYKVETSHLSSLSERESSAVNRDRQLKALQERLEQQQHENSEERTRLQALVTKLELQLTEQTREVEQERWRVRQEGARVRSLQTSLEEEKKILMQATQKDRNELEKAKDHLLDEQKTILSQLQEERRSLAEERAKFDVSQRLASDQHHRENAKTVRAEVEVESTVRALNDEKIRLSELRQELTREKSRIEQQKLANDQEKELIKMKQQEIESMAMQVNQSTRDMDQMSVAAARFREEGQQALTAAKKIEGEHTQKLQRIQADLTTLRAKEKQIAQERLSLAREKQDVENLRGSVLCVNCSTPVRDSAQTPQNVAVVNPQFSISQKNPPLKRTAGAQKLFQSLPSDLKSNVQGNVSQAIETDRSIRMWKISAQKDKMFLQEESMFLHALKHAPYHDVQ